MHTKVKENVNIFPNMSKKGIIALNIKKEILISFEILFNEVSMTIV